MSDLRYKLASNKVPKLDCPRCRAKRHWQRYIDTHTGEVLPEEHGRCDNSDKCGEWVTPIQTGYAKGVWRSETVQGYRYEKPQQAPASPEPLPEYFDFDTFKKTLDPAQFENNVFLLNIVHRIRYPFPFDEVSEVARNYYLGTIAEGERAGAVTFPFIDAAGHVRAVQVKQFDTANHTAGHADKLDKIILRSLQKKKQPIPDWLTKYIKYGDARGYYNCLFGEHLLPLHPGKPVALVEAPKTAIYGALYFRQSRVPFLSDCIWLAVGAKDYLTFERVAPLAGRRVFVFPDLSATGKTFKDWDRKLRDFESRLHGTRFVLSDLLERLATPEQRNKAADIADLLEKINWRDFRPANEPTQPPKPAISIPVAPVRVRVLQPEQAAPEFQSWSKEIEDLEIFFADWLPPALPIKLSGCTTVTDAQAFVCTHLATAKENNGKRAFRPYLERLQALKTQLNNTQVP